MPIECHPVKQLLKESHWRRFRDGICRKTDGTQRWKEWSFPLAGALFSFISRFGFARAFRPEFSMRIADEFARRIQGQRPAKSLLGARHIVDRCAGDRQVGPGTGGGRFLLHDRAENRHRLFKPFCLQQVVPARFATAGNAGSREQGASNFDLSRGHQKRTLPM